jgi:hypothetical protein
LIAVILAVLLASTLTFVSLSVSSNFNKQTVSVSVTTVQLVPQPLNYTAYDIHGPGTSEIQLSYSTQSNTEPSSNNTSSIGLVRLVEEENNTNISETPCGESTNGTTSSCGVEIDSAEPIVDYEGNATVVYTITVLNQAGVDGTYLLFPADTTCGTYILLIVGNQIPKTLPNISFHCPIISPGQITRVLVMGITNMTGLNLPPS